MSKDSLEVLVNVPDKWGKYLDALAATFPGKSVETKRYKGGSDILICWGLGGAEQWRAFRAQRAAGKTVIGIDLPYWRRDAGLGADRHVKISINAQQPIANKLPPASIDRFMSFGVNLRETYDPSGPVVLGGLGAKSRAWLGYKGPQWELKRAQEIRARFPDKQIIYRPKNMRHERLPVDNCVTQGTGPIESVLSGASLVVVRHSNVAVDCVINGVPCVCEHNAANYLWPDTLNGEHALPDREARLEFLGRLAHWQYSLKELRAGIWPWLFERIKDCES
jgi:hypothetical protein